MTIEEVVEGIAKGSRAEWTLIHPMQWLEQPTTMMPVTASHQITTIEVSIEQPSTIGG